MRPSTIDVPSVPALKLTKPSCITVVPSARWAPSRTRSASAIRTPPGSDVVDHPRELVDAVDGDVPVRRAQPPPRRLEVGDGARAGAGPDDVRQDAEDPVQVDRARRDEAVAQQVQPQVGVRRVGRRRVEVDLDPAELDADVADVVGALRLLPRGGGRLVGGGAQPRVPGSRCRARRVACTVARPHPQASRRAGVGRAASGLSPGVMHPRLGGPYVGRVARHARVAPGVPARARPHRRPHRAAGRPGGHRVGQRGRGPHHRRDPGRARAARPPRADPRRRRPGGAYAARSRGAGGARRAHRHRADRRERAVDDHGRGRRPRRARPRQPAT